MCSATWRRRYLPMSKPREEGEGKEVRRGAGRVDEDEDEDEEVEVEVEVGSPA